MCAVRGNKGAVVLQAREQKERLKWLPYAMSDACVLRVRRFQY